MIWFFVCVVAFLFEIITPTALVSVWFIFGAIGACIASLLHVSLLIQVVIFVVLSILCLVLLRPVATRYFYKHKVATNVDRLIGESALVIKDITKDSWGQVSVQGSIWHAISEHKDCILKGERVKVIAIDGVKLIVRKQER